ncbi:MAG: CBS domain-containing protein [Pseudobdellovibrionaceae bacterium]
MDIVKYKIIFSAKLSQALEKIEENKSGAVLVINDNDEVLGIITDGDVRRLLLSGIKTDDMIENCYNSQFTYVGKNISREKILKILDQKVNFLPVLDSQKKLIQVFTRKDFPIEQEKGSLVRSRAPVRISFGGGGTDLTYFFSGSSGAVINATIKMYAHCELEKLESNQITINSFDFDKSVTTENVEDLFLHKEFQLIGSCRRGLSDGNRGTGQEPK